MQSIGSENVVERRQAAQVVIALRRKYISDALIAIKTGQQKQVEVTEIAASYQVLQSLRPSDQQTARTAADRITFQYIEPHGPRVTRIYSPIYPAADLLVRMSLSALPVLASTMTSQPKGTTQPANSTLASATCVISILGPATADWMSVSAQALNEPQSKILADFALSIRTRQIHPGHLNFVPFEQGVGQLLTGGYDPDIYSLDTASQTINWHLGEDLEDKSKANEAAIQINRTFQFIEICLLEGIQSDRQRVKGYVAIPPAAQIDGVRLLGALRSDMAPWVIWDHLRQISMKTFVDKDGSEMTQTCIRSLAQIDIPAVSVLSKRIATEWANPQQRAATFALGKIMGRYAPAFIDQEISSYQDAAANDKDLHDQYLEQVKRLKGMLELGKEKRWFTGDYYGAHDPHAYDLIFDDVPAPAKAN